LSTGRLWKLTLMVCSVVAVCDAASGPHLVLTGFLAAGPCCALLAARWALTAAAGCHALALGTVLGIPDRIFATLTSTRCRPPSPLPAGRLPSARRSCSASIADWVTPAGAVTVWSPALRAAPGPPAVTRRS
jgi:hypothetical protein